MIKQIYSVPFFIIHSVYSINYMNLSEYLYVLGLDLLPFIFYIGYSIKPRKGFYYLSFAIVLSLTISSFIKNGITPNIETIDYILISINSSILSLMLIGHWFLVDPTIDRYGMKQIARYGIVASSIEMLLQIFSLSNGTSTVSYPYSYVVIGLLLATGVLAAAANSSLNEKGYSGVMAATGLSYLSFLTSIGAVGTLLLTS